MVNIMTSCQLEAQGTCGMNGSEIVISDYLRFGSPPG